MEENQRKYDLPVINSELFLLEPDRYELRKGSTLDAPPCPYGHRFKWIGYDKVELKYVRVTKSVFKKLINRLDQEIVRRHEADFEEGKSEL